MPQPIITGNSLLDKLASGPYVKNPNYNPKTKAGKTQPPVLLDTSAGDVHGGAISQSSIASDKLSFTYNDTNMDLMIFVEMKKWVLLIVLTIVKMN